MKRLITIFVAILIAECAMAQENYDFSAECESGQTLYYKITSNTEPYTVMVIRGEIKPSGDLVIPSTVTYNGKAYSVTSIGRFSFEECSSLTSINIPNSVTKIEVEAFQDCIRVASINIPNSVTEIGWGAFSGCSALTSINIPNSVTEIGSGAFAGCSALTSITIPNSVTSIGKEAFEYCIGLTTINIPNSVTEIGNAAFSGCKSLPQETVEKIRSINDRALKDW